MDFASQPHCHPPNHHRASALNVKKFLPMAMSALGANDMRTVRPRTSRTGERFISLWGRRFCLLKRVVDQKTWLFLLLFIHVFWVWIPVGECAGLLVVISLSCSYLSDWPPKVHSELLRLAPKLEQLERKSQSSERVLDPYQIDSERMFENRQVSLCKQ